MTTITTNLIIEIKTVDQEVKDQSCNLSWKIEDEDNNNPECFLVGTTYIARLFKSPDSLSIIARNTNGNIEATGNFETEIIEDEYITFQGSSEASIKFPNCGSFSYEMIGDAYDLDGNIIPSITIEGSIGGMKLFASEKCFFVIKANYKTKYYTYKFTGMEEGTLLLIAISECRTESIYEAISVDIKESCTEEEDEEGDLCAAIELEVDTSSKEGQKATSEGKAIILVKGIIKKRLSAVATLGTISYQGEQDKVIEAEVTVINGKVSFSDKIIRLMSQTVLNGYVGKLVVINGDLEMSKNPYSKTDSNGIPYGFGIVKIKYVTKALKFLISSYKAGKGIFIAKDISGPSCAFVSIEYILGKEDEDENQEKYDITLIYKDFVTGEPLGEADVYLDNASIGKTDENGKLIALQVTANTKHQLKASKPGYLNTDSDSLANDDFIIRD